MAGTEDDFTEADLQEQAAVPPLHRAPEKEAEPEPQAQSEEGKEPQQQTDDGAQTDTELPEHLKGKYVPHGRFHETSQRLKEERQARLVTEDRTNRLLAILQQQVAQQAPQQQQAPAEDKMPDDPIEKIEWLTKKVGAFEQQEQQRSQYTRQVQDWDNYAAQVTNAAGRDFARAVADDPGLKDMYNFVTASRIGELMATGGMSKQQAEQQLKIEEVQGYGQAYQNGRSPDQVIRALAQARGYRPQPAVNQNAPAEIPQERRDQHRSLSQMGGKQGPSRLTAKDLAKMSEDEFSELSDKTIKSLMRG